MSPPVNICLEGRLAAEFDPHDYQYDLDVLRGRLDGPDLKFPVETRLTRGFAAEEILRLTAEVGCDLIVMGTHGRTGLGRLIMGNTAQSVLPQAECPVMVVKAPRRAPEATAEGPADKQAVGTH
jgi:nucleotide-binding universal stress UspA family protein